MKNKDKLKNNFTKSKAITGDTNALVNSIEANSGEYSFCLHSHYDNPRLTGWIKAIGTDGFAEFEIEEGGVVVVDIGRYTDEEAQEMKKIIEDWLSKDA